MDPGSERLSCLLYLRGVLPALTEHGAAVGLLPVRGGIVFHGTGCIRGAWPLLKDAELVKGAPGYLHLHFFRMRDVRGFFEQRRFRMCPGRGFWRLSLLLKFRKAGQSLEAALRNPRPPVTLRALQLRLMLRCAGLLHEAMGSGARKLPPGIAIFELFPEEGCAPVSVWAGADSSGSLVWGEGRPPEIPAGRVRLFGQPVLNQLFSGKLIGEEAVARGEIAMEGDIPLIQALNLVFEDLERYIRPL